MRGRHVGLSPAGAVALLDEVPEPFIHVDADHLRATNGQEEHQQVGLAAKVDDRVPGCTMIESRMKRYSP